MNILAHFIYNIVYIYFTYIATKILINTKSNQTKFKKILTRLCFIFGVLGYILYLVVIISSVIEGSSFEGSFQLLTTSWVFMFAVERINSK